MSGHSKWHNIQGRKNAQDAKRGKIFQKLARDLYTAAKAGGVDPDSNAGLRLVIDKAKADEEERLKNAPLQVEVTRREKKPRPHKKK